MNFSDLKIKHEIIQKYVDTIGDEELSVLSAFMRSRIATPESYVTMLGETSSGKTTLINGLLNKKLLKTSAAPTTGSIIEIMFDSEVESPEFFAINRNATMEKLDPATFEALSSNPDDLLSRLRVKVSNQKGFSGLRLFDTPGYGSIIDKHEEILREFIPNSDVIIYVIGYKIGIQENDFLFMRCIDELIHDDTDVVVVVNRCPASVNNNDRRLSEIRRYAYDLFHKEVPIFTVPAETDSNGDSLPQANDLWAYVNKLINSSERQEKLTDALNSYLDDLIMYADSIVEKRDIAGILNNEEKEALKVMSDNLRCKGKKIIDDIIIPTFDGIIDETPAILKKARDNIFEDLSQKVNNEDTGRMDETVAFINNHSLPYSINREINEYQRYLLAYLDDMNEKVDNYLNEAIADYHSEIKIRFATNTEFTMRSSGIKLISKLMKNGLNKFFKGFGGAGGSGAGVANAAKHALKKFGDLFGKKFSRETYNKLAHFLKLIKLTSAKAVGNVITVIMEFAQLIFDYSTWKLKLKKKIDKGLNEWYKNTVATITDDLKNLKDENIKTLTEIIEDNASAFEFEETDEVDNISELKAIKEETHKKLEELNYGI